MVNIMKNKSIWINNNVVNLTPGMTLLIPKKNNEYFNYYKVNKGDTLFNIAKKYNVNVNMLSMLNGLDKNDYIYPNQEILIPSKSPSLSNCLDNDLGVKEINIIIMIVIKMTIADNNEIINFFNFEIETFFLTIIVSVSLFSNSSSRETLK